MKDINYRVTRTLDNGVKLDIDFKDDKGYVNVYHGDRDNTQEYHLKRIRACLANAIDLDHIDKEVLVHTNDIRYLDS